MDFKHFGAKGLTCRRELVPVRFFHGCVTGWRRRMRRREENEKTDARVALNLFPRALCDAAIKREWTGAIYACRDYPIDNWQWPDNRRNSVAWLPYTKDRSNLSPSTYLTTIAPLLSGRGSIGRSSKRNFCNCSIESPARSLASPLLSFNDHRIHCLDLGTSDGMKLAKVRRNIVVE